MKDLKLQRSETVCQVGANSNDSGADIMDDFQLIEEEEEEGDILERLTTQEH